MENTLANIAYRQSWNNLVDLPANLSSLLYNANVSPQEVVVELVSGTTGKCYVGWSGMSSGGAKLIAIDPIFAQSLKLAEKQAITVNVKIKNFKATNIFLEPEHSSDWELVELHAAYIESKLIEQSRCVAVGQVLVVYPTKTSSVKLQVKDIGSQDHKYAIIDPFAEISIAPKLKEKKRSSSTHSVKSARSSRSTADDTNHGPSVLKRGISLPSGLFPSTELLDDTEEGLSVYINFDEVLSTLNRAEYVAVSVVPGPDSKTNNAPSNESSQPTPEGQTIQGKEEKDKSVSKVTENKIVIARLCNHRNCPSNTVGLSVKLANALNVGGEIGVKILLRQAQKATSKKPSAFIIHPYITKTKKADALQLNSSSKNDKQQSIVNTLSKALLDPQISITKSPVTNFMKLAPIPIILPHGGILEFKKNADPLAWIKPFEINGSKLAPRIELGDEVLRSVSFFEEVVKEDLDEIYGADKITDEIIEFISMFENSGVMLHGVSGSGKTLLLKKISQILSFDYGFNTKFVSCENFMNENQDQLHQRFVKWLQDCSWKEPSVLILDNLDKILSAEVEHGDSSVSNQLTELLVSQIQRIHLKKQTNLSLIFTGISRESFNKLLGQTHLIESYFHLRPPEKATRALILQKYLTEELNCKVSFDIMDIVLETEGYLPNDLKLLSDRILHESLFDDQTRQDAESGVITKKQFERALQGYTPSNLRGVKLQKSSTSWGDIGGLLEAKKVLLETLEWPTKYAPIFANCPLRLRSGILLYGYPGCGKTLLASAIAGQCGLNFISIKGPEILNKYIGASEQSVRELFERAQSAKPCILFFDEFDSIAPKRGHDSTGVTDRVVNQMLTQMDGAESLDGVYVLAATSRPDLIDSALLRPGRLDKSIICDMPSFEDRLDILRCISAKMDLGDDVNLDMIAKETEGFSGADMQGLGYNAYLKAVHEKLAASEAQITDSAPSSKQIDFFKVSSEIAKGKSMRPADKVKILQQIERLFDDEKSKKPAKSQEKNKDASKVLLTQEHFLESLKETKPSISVTEKNKLSKIYDQFMTGRDGKMPDGSASNEIGGRTTLM